MRIGIDVSETRTDAALVLGADVLATATTAATGDLAGGITRAVRALIGSAPADVARCDAVVLSSGRIRRALEGRVGLAPVAVIRLGLPATTALPPLSTWPTDLQTAVAGQAYLCGGGHDYDGAELSPFDVAGFRTIVDRAHRAGARSFAVSSVFSPVDPAMERLAGRLLVESLPDVQVSLSHELGQLGLLARENTTVLNAALRTAAAGLISSVLTALRGLRVVAPLYFSRTDGLLMGADYARRYPVALLDGGPANMLRGAARLAGARSCVVVDVGDRQTHVGVVHEDQPRPAPEGIVVAGVDTSLSAPDLELVPVGRETVDRLGPADVELVLARAVRAVAGTGPVVVVGPGAELVPERLGDVPVVRPSNGQWAGAVGAATAHVGGDVDRLTVVRSGELDEAVESVEREALDRAVAAGADPSSVRVEQVETVPVGYLREEAFRIRVRAVGDIDVADRLPAPLEVHRC